MKLSDYVIQFLARLGTRHVFMLPGGGAMHLNDSLGRCKDLEYVCNLHEQGASIAAEAYAQFSGLGILLVTTGPGGTNSITGVAGAWLESSPLLVISGQVKRSDMALKRRVRQIGFQEIDIVSIVAPITKFAVTVLEPNTIRRCLEEALWYARNGRKGPVWVDIPVDVQAANIDDKSLAPFVPPIAEDDIVAFKSAVERSFDMICASRRPVILVGNGVRLSNSLRIFIEWAEMTGIPILTTWKALDFIPEDHPLFAGRPGSVGQRSANLTQQTADLFISIGARLDAGQTAYNHGTFAPRAKKIVVDIDESEIAKLNMPLDVSLVCDARRFINEMYSVCRDNKEKLPNWMDWVMRCKLLRERFPIVIDEFRDLRDGVNNYILVDAIGRLLVPGDVMVPGSSGACSEVTAQAIPVMTGIRYINTHGLGAMGFGVPAALGACLASGNKRTICIDGDGGFAMNAQELAVVSRLQLPIKIFVLNNGGYGSIRATQINYFNRHFVACDVDSGLSLPSIRMTALTYKIQYRCISDQVAISEAVKEVLDAQGPIICEVLIAPDQYTQPKVTSKTLSDGSMVTSPMEDMWPFLAPEELAHILAS